MRRSGPDAATRQAVCEREQGRCACCGILIRPFDWFSIQHRLARGQGGGNDLPNLILLCGSATSPGCHRKAEDRDKAMHERGMWVASWEDPRQVPVTLWDDRRVWLADDGAYADAPDKGARGC